MICEALISDAPRASALLRATFDDGLYTPAGIRYRMATAQPEARMGYWKAERAGELIGWAYAGINTSSPSPYSGFSGVVVGSSERRNGVGDALWKAVSAHIDEIGVRKLVVHSEADADSMRFATVRGFSLAATATSLAVDPRTIARTASLPPEVELRPFSAFVDDPEPVYQADRESILDEPGAEDFSGITFENWLLHHWEHPDSDRELGLVALVDGEIAGMTFLMTDRERGRALNGGTGVRRAFRGRRIGLLMKQYSLAAAAESGIVIVLTQNDETNAPMMAINERLGYKPVSSSHSWVLER